MLRQQVRAVSSLLTTMTLIGLCVGMTSTLLSLRATLEGFSTLTTGIIMSAYFLGFLFGSTRAPKDIRRVGYIRAFGGLAALASVSILVQSIWIDPIIWFLFRFLSGFALSAMFVIAESWLNTMADNKNRGAMLSIYMVLIYGGLIVGQLILGIADPGTFVPFAIVAMLINLSLVPILASVTVEPTTHSPKKVSLRVLLEQAPLGIITAFVIQACYAMFYGVGPVYAIYLGLSVPQVTLFMAAYIFGGLVAQTPVGLLSDKFDRRAVLAGCAAASAFFAFVLSQLPATYPWVIYLLMALLGASILPLYSLSMAHTNDFLERDQMIGATGAIIKVGGIGAVIGAPSVAAMMQFGQINLFFILIGILSGGVALYALYRIGKRERATDQAHTAFAALAPAQTSEELVYTLVDETHGQEEDEEQEESPAITVTGPPVKEDSES
ncbi:MULTISPECIES: MFS transporter [Gammaproteobacteria]|uniref:MFS transporter n=1 Tax=Gammaproteobacteria TaxID=1236 RepID=UPI000DD015EC|nr:MULTISPECIES: MFS transporter [Gammaproteobacteria]RTE87031.1 MFS transporter [Aliidiomarina sp. B3213]TCZ93179.1 MFS transporter [Lysobacter sp. N42]